MVNLEIKFIMDGTGVYYMPHEGIMIDALVQWALMPDSTMMKNDKPDEMELPFKKWNIDGHSGYYASSLFPDNIQGETLQYWRKRFRENRIEMINKNVETTLGTYRNYSVPMPLIMCRVMIGYAVGEKKEIESALKKIKFLGKKRAYGKGGVVGLQIKEIEEDFSIFKDNQYMRYMPVPDGDRYGRIRPPYWNNHGRVNTNFIGDKI